MLACVGALARAQATRGVVLTRANATTTNQFSAVASVRELRDGRVLVMDKRDNLVYVVDFTAGTIMQVGRHGRGPGEYEQAGRLWPLGGDSTLMLEPMARRGLMFNGSQVAQTISATSPLLASVAQPMSRQGGLENVVPAGCQRGGAISHRRSSAEALRVVVDGEHGGHRNE